MPTEWETYKNKCNFYSICVWCDIYSSSNIDSGVFPIGPNAFSCTEHLKKKQSQMLCQVKVLSKQKREVLPCSVMLTGPHCQSDRAAHQTSAPTLLSRTKGAEKRCQIIWQAKWDIFIRSSTPSQTGANVSRGVDHSPLQTSATETRPALPLHQCLYPEICSPFFFPADRIVTNHQQNESQACNNNFWKTF